MPCHVHVPRYQVVHHLLLIWPALTKMLLHVDPIKSHHGSFSNSRQTGKKQRRKQVKGSTGEEWFWEEIERKIYRVFFNTSSNLLIPLSAFSQLGLLLFVTYIRISINGSPSFPSNFISQTLLSLCGSFCPKGRVYVSPRSSTSCELTRFIKFCGVDGYNASGK